MAVLTARQVVSEKVQKAADQRRVFREKQSVGTPRPLKKSLPPVPYSAAASFKKYEASVVDIKRAVDTKKYIQSLKDDKHAYECWLASYAQFGNDLSMERKATISRKNKPDKKAVVNKVFACWLEDGDHWGDPDSRRHKDGIGYPTRDKYEKRSSYSTYVRRRLQVHVNPSQEMLKTVWDRSMSKFSHLHPKGCEWIHRPPTVNELLAQTWPKTGLFSTNSSPLPVLKQQDSGVTVDNVFDGRYATAASNDEIEQWSREDEVALTGSVKIKVWDSVNQQHVMYDPVEYHREAEKRYIWFLCNSPKKAEVDGKQYKSVADSWKREPPAAFVGPLLPFKLYTGSGFAKWSRKVESRVGYLNSYEHYWLGDDERRYQMTLAAMPNDPRRRITPRRRVDSSHDGLLNFWEHQARVGRAGPEMAEKVRVLKSLKEEKAERLSTLLSPAPYHPIVPVGESYGDWDDEVKEMSVRYHMHPEKVLEMLKAIDNKEPMSDSEYQRAVNIVPDDAAIAGTAEKLSASFTSELGVRYFKVGSILVPEKVATSSTILILKEKNVQVHKEVSDAIDGVVQELTQSPKSRPSSRFKKREDMNFFEKVKDTLENVGILSA